MALPEYDATLPEYLVQPSNSCWLRQFTSYPSSTPGGSVKRTSRVTKQISASNSPNHVQRRRTTANHSSRAHSRLSQDKAYQTREQQLRNFYSSQQHMRYSRPMSWHPGFDVSHHSSVQAQHREPALGNAIDGLEKLDVNGTPSSSVQQSIHNAFSMGYGYPLQTSTSAYSNVPAAASSYGKPFPDDECSYDSYPMYSISDQAQPQCGAQQPMYPDHGGMDYQLPQQWHEMGPESINTAAVSYSTSEMSSMSVQLPSEATKQRRAHDDVQVSKKKSKELVGMGLYDDKDNGFMLGIDSVSLQDPSRDSVGKGLKLEETWQPPNEPDDEEDEDGYSTDEAEEAEEVPPEPVPTTFPGTQKTVYPPHADLSNQSFFFEEDEYIGETPYSDYYTLGQGLHGNLPDQIPNPAMYNYMWR